MKYFIHGRCLEFETSSLAQRMSIRVDLCKGAEFHAEAKMKRWHEEAGRTRRKWEFYKSINSGGKYKVGHFRKRKPLDCGNTRCHVCHCEKLLGYPRRQEIVADINMKEQLDELGKHPG